MADRPNWRRGENRDHWDERQRRAYYRAFNRRAHADAVAGVTSGSAFRCRDARCPCGGATVVYWRKPQNGETFRPETHLWDAQGRHFARFNANTRPDSPYRRHTQADLRQARGEILRRLAADEGVRPVGVRGRRADAIRLAAEVLDRSQDRGKEVLAELVAAGYIDGRTYAVLQYPRKFGVSAAALRHGANVRAGELERAVKAQSKADTCPCKPTKPSEKNRGAYLPSTKRTCSTSVPSAPFASAMRSGEDGSGAPVGATRLVREGREVRKALLRLKGGGGRGGRGIFPPPDEEPDIERSQR